MAFGRRPPPHDPFKERLRKVSERPAAPLAPQKAPRAPRQALFRNGALNYGDGHRMAVIIKDLSDRGARIEFFVNLNLPELVVLSEPTLRLRRSARVVWQTDGAAGLAFVD